MAKKVEQTGNIKPTESQYATVNADELLSANPPATAHNAETLYNQQNYTLMVIGLVLVILGFFLMRGGLYSRHQGKKSGLSRLLRGTKAF